MIEGFHQYKDAPHFCEYLRARHRHIFHIRCWWDVSFNDREIEINHQQNYLEDTLHSLYGNGACEFGYMSCEDICEQILKTFPLIDKVEVLEDGYGGASFTR